MIKLWEFRIVWCEQCRRLVRWNRGAHLRSHPLPPGVTRDERPTPGMVSCNCGSLDGSGDDGNQLNPCCPRHGATGV